MANATERWIDVRQLDRLTRRRGDSQIYIRERKWIKMGKGARMRSYKKRARRIQRRLDREVIREQWWSMQAFYWHDFGDQLVSDNSPPPGVY